MKVGIIQGRLSKPDNGFQECPVDWKREFNLLESLDLNHIEWIVTKYLFKTNPIFSEDVSNYAISSICADNLVDARIIEKTYFFENILPICDAATKNGIQNITIPLLEDSDMTDDIFRSLFCSYVKDVSERYENLSFSIEAELAPDKLDEIVSINDRFRVTYDTGNITSFGLNHDDYIRRFGDRINNVHLKDRTFKAQTVAPLTGDTDFRQIFKSLKNMNYDGIFTLQTAREATGAEVKTITQHRNIFEELYNECA